MKKLNLWLLASLFVAALTLTACSKDDDDKDDPKKEQLSAKDLIGTWIYTNPEKEGHFLELTLAEDNTFSFSVHYQNNEQIQTWEGSWAEEDDHIVVTCNKYTGVHNDTENVESQSNLYYKKMANGILMYFDEALPVVGSTYGGIYVREGETLDVSKLQTKDKELIGKWETENKENRYVINADGTMEYAYKSFIYLITLKGIIVEINPLKVGEGEEIKQFVSILSGSFITPQIIQAEVYCYAIQDDMLYVGLSKSVESLDDLLNTEPYTQAAEE